MDERWVWISLPKATFGIRVNAEGVVDDAAPIGRWMIVKKFRTIHGWVIRKGGELKMLPVEEEA